MKCCPVYALGSLPEAPSVIHEIRKVVSVDGKQVTSRAKAREAMTLGLHSGQTTSSRKSSWRILRNMDYGEP